MYLIHRLLSGTLALGAVLLAAQGANAESLLPALTGKTQLGPALYRYFYSVDLTGTSTGSNVDNGSFFTMYDFLGFTGSTAQVSSVAGTWTPTTSFLGTNAIGTTPFDSVTSLNVTYTYTGPNQIADVKPIFSFYIDSTFGTTSAIRNVQYTGQDFDNTDVIQGNIGRVQGAAVPELSTVAIFACLVGTGALGLRRRTKRA